MGNSVRQFIVGRDRLVTRQIFAIAAVLSVAAFGTVAVPAVWAEYVSASGAETMRLATAAGFLISVVAAVYVVSRTSGINPYVPIAAVFVVLVSYGVTGIISGSQLLFLLGPSILLGILAALSAYANDGAVASLSVVFFPVFSYMINAPYGIAAGLSTVNRVRIALVFSLLFTFSIGIAGFLIGTMIRRLVDYGGFLTSDELDPKIVESAEVTTPTREPESSPLMQVVDVMSTDDADTTELTDETTSTTQPSDSDSNSNSDSNADSKSEYK